MKTILSTLVLVVTSLVFNSTISFAQNSCSSVLTSLTQIELSNLSKVLTIEWNQYHEGTKLHSRGWYKQSTTPNENLIQELSDSVKNEPELQQQINEYRHVFNLFPTHNLTANETLEIILSSKKYDLNAEGIAKDYLEFHQIYKNSELSESLSQRQALLSVDDIAQIQLYSKSFSISFANMINEIRRLSRQMDGTEGLMNSRTLRISFNPTHNLKNAMNILKFHRQRPDLGAAAGDALKTLQSVRIANTKKHLETRPFYGRYGGPFNRTVEVTDIPDLRESFEIWEKVNPLKSH